MEIGDADRSVVLFVKSDGGFVVVVVVVVIEDEETLDSRCLFCLTKRLRKSLSTRATLEGCGGWDSGVNCGCFLVDDGGGGGSSDGRGNFEGVS